MRAFTTSMAPSASSAGQHLGLHDAQPARHQRPRHRGDRVEHRCGDEGHEPAVAERALAVGQRARDAAGSHAMPPMPARHGVSTTAAASTPTRATCRPGSAHRRRCGRRGTPRRRPPAAPTQRRAHRGPTTRAAARPAVGVGPRSYRRRREPGPGAPTGHGDALQQRPFGGQRFADHAARSVSPFGACGRRGGGLPRPACACGCGC